MFVELGTATNFSFLRGASHPEEYVAMAGGFAMPALGIADRNSLAGVVRAFSQAKRLEGPPVRVLVGARLVFADGTPDILAYPTDLAAYGRLCRLLTAGNRRAAKGSCILALTDLLDWIEGLRLIVLDRSSAVEADAVPHADPALGEAGLKDLRADDLPPPAAAVEGMLRAWLRFVPPPSPANDNPDTGLSLIHISEP
ncbi:PHP domain-containing protein, partial [Lichenihabitans sp. Uapishka_5]